MQENIRLGRVAGIRVGAHWSLLIVFWLFVVSLAGSQLPHSAPGHSIPAYYLMAIAVAAVFYACLLAHELAHAIVARRHGIGVEGIVLWLLGGVSKLKGEPTDPSVELRVAVAGPATSLALGLGFFVAARLAGPGLPGAGLGWLGWVNAALALFNLLPAFPLDGGRVLRALLWRRHADGDRVARTHATAVAAGVGRRFGIALIGLGVLGLFATTAGLGALWFALIGWFIVFASRSEAEVSAVRSEVAGLRVGDAMTPDPLTVPEWVTLDVLWERGVEGRRLSSFPVVDAGGWFAGLATLSRMRRVPPGYWPTTTVRDVALPPARCVTASPDDDLGHVAVRINASPERRVVVLERGHVVGIVTPGDIARAAAPERVPVA